MRPRPRGTLLRARLRLAGGVCVVEGPAEELDRVGRTEMGKLADLPAAEGTVTEDDRSWIVAAAPVGPGAPPALAALPVPTVPALAPAGLLGPAGLPGQSGAVFQDPSPGGE